MLVNPLLLLVVCTKPLLPSVPYPPLPCSWHDPQNFIFCAQTGSTTECWNDRNIVRSGVSLGSSFVGLGFLFLMSPVVVCNVSAFDVIPPGLSVDDSLLYSSPSVRELSVCRTFNCLTLLGRAATHIRLLRNLCSHKQKYSPGLVLDKTLPHLESYMTLQTGKRIRGTHNKSISNRSYHTGTYGPVLQFLTGAVSVGTRRP